MNGSAADGVREAAQRLGFGRVGFAAVDDAEEAQAHERFVRWLDAGMGAGLDYLRRGADRRRSVTLSLQGARSVVVVARSYNHSTPEPPPGAARISRYAAGRDYHKVMERDLKRLAVELAEIEPGSQSRWYVDTGPVLERAWAERAGVGWIGKNTCAIHPKLGSYFFIGVILTTMELLADAPATDHCGSCTLCLEACPTGALPEPYVLDSRRCIAYWNVEHRGDFPAGIAELIGEHAFGCDICQEVCPWNRPDRAAPPADDELAPAPGRLSRDAVALARDVLDDPEEVLRGSAMRRAKRQGLARNVAAVLANLGREDGLEVLDVLAGDEDEVVASAARDAAKRLRGAS